ncbi:G protein-coupled receptor, class C, group 5, member Ba isoform X1 [Lates japonicus]|uniref:G protein-coupled receptor, class C, group 5, member Ba isoform X1 n=1 Tax=Lates japonicus TaxID=270547 RepID=A0AAD3N7H2_LATJO|nr:G protein-coupled receptor, class C, group 5, member Ba isoform X1 [Lates japonicus]
MQAGRREPPELLRLCPRTAWSALPPQVSAVALRLLLTVKRGGRAARQYLPRTLTVSLQPRTALLPAATDCRPGPVWEGHRQRCTPSGRWVTRLLSLWVPVGFYLYGNAWLKPTASQTIGSTSQNSTRTETIDEDIPLSQAASGEPGPRIQPIFYFMPPEVSGGGAGQHNTNTARPSASSRSNASPTQSSDYDPERERREHILQSQGTCTDGYLSQTSPPGQHLPTVRMSFCCLSHRWHMKVETFGSCPPSIHGVVGEGKAHRQLCNELSNLSLKEPPASVVWYSMQESLCSFPTSQLYHSNKPSSPDCYHLPTP